MLKDGAVTEKEKTLLAGCLKGDKAAWDAFVLEYSALVYHTVKKTLVLHHAEISPDLVDDLFQDIFLTLVKDEFAQLRRFRGDNGCTLASWLRMIAARRTIDHLRKSKISPEPFDELLHDGPAHAAEEPLDHDQIQLLAKAVEDLSPRERILVDLFFRKGLPAEDVAAILRVSIGAVYTQKSRILSKLRETLEKSGSM